jgi:hypothetical protein
MGEYGCAIGAATGPAYERSRLPDWPDKDEEGVPVIRNYWELSPDEGVTGRWSEQRSAFSS